MSKVPVPVHTQYIETDDVCNSQVQKALMEAVPNIVTEVTWNTDGRTHNN